MKQIGISTNLFKVKQVIKNKDVTKDFTMYFNNLNSFVKNHLWDYSHI